jgi:predicted phosphodiesterase
MRIAVLSDIHGNLTAFEAVVADLERLSPDVIFHGGDLADAGSSPVEIVDRIRQFGWQGVIGNTDEMLFCPESLEEFASQSAAPAGIWDLVREMAAATRSALGEERIAWLSQLPRVQIRRPLALVHATSESCWRAPGADATEAEIQAIYGSLGEPFVVFGHTHRPFIRSIEALGMTLINSGSVGLSYDGDPRASYLLLEGNTPSIRRVEYDVKREVKALKSSGIPGAEWTAKMMLSASPQMP